MLANGPDGTAGTYDALHHGAPSTPWTRNAAGVNTVFGHALHQQVDLTLPGRGVPIGVARSYSSADVTDAGFGFGWSWSFGASITYELPSSIIVRNPDGRRDRYTTTDGVNFTPPAGIYHTLVKNADGTYTLTTHDQLVQRFDAGGRLTSIADRNNLTTTVTYATTGLANGTGGVTLTDPAGRTLTLAYGTGADAKHFVSLTESGPLGRRITYGYNPAGDLTTVTFVGMRSGPAGLLDGVTQLTYDANHRLLTVQDPEGRTALTNGYDAQGRVASQRDGRGNARNVGPDLAFDYDRPNQTKVTDRRGNATTYEFDGGYRVTAVVDAQGQPTRFRYDSGNNLDCVTDVRGGKTGFRYEDGRGNVTKAIDALNTDASCNLKAGGVQRAYTYTARNDLDLLTDERNRQTKHRYDGRGNLTEVIQAYNVPTSSMLTAMRVDEAGELRVFADEMQSFAVDGYHTIFTPDPANGDLLAVQDANNHTTTFQYDVWGNRRLMTLPTDPADANDPAGKTTEWTYDAGSRLKARKDALGNQTSYEYEPDNRPKSVTIRPAVGVEVTTTYTYDRVGNLKSVTQPLAEVAGVRTARVTEYDYDENNNPRLVQVKADGAVVQQTSADYDPNDNLLSFVDADGRRTEYEYDPLDRPKVVRSPQPDPAAPQRVLTEYAYDDPTGTVTVTDRNAQAVVHRADLLGRPAQISYPNGETVGYEYYETGPRKRMVDATGETFYSYDELDRLKTVTTDGPAGPQTVQVAYDYDNVGNRTGITYPGATSGGARFKVTYAYAHDNQLRAVQHGEGAALQTTRYQYDAAGRLRNTRYPNGIVASYGYDQADRLTDIAHTGPNDVLVTRHTYTPDLAGRRERADEVVPPATGLVTNRYQYDALDRLREVAYPALDADTPARTVRYDYTPGGNRRTAEVVGEATTTYQYDGAGRLKGDGVTVYTYDANGNQKTRSTQAGVGPYPEDRFTYDAANRLTGATVYNAQARAFATSAYRYNGDGVRVESATDGVATRFVQDAARANPVVLEDGRAFYVWGHGLVARVAPDGATRHYHADGLGSTRAVTSGHGDGTVGAVQAWANYEVFGGTRRVSGADPGALLFAGEWADRETGLYHLRARQYDPATGRFTSQDPLGYGGGENLYAYAGNSPTNNVDPSGLYWETALDLAFIGYDLHQLVTGGAAHRRANLIALGLDAAGAALPLATGLGAAYRAGRLADNGDEVVSLYRAVSQNELADIQKFGGFRPDPAGRSYVFAKLFATSAEDAASYGRINYRLPGGHPFTVVEATIPKILADRFISRKMDGMTAVDVLAEYLPEFNAAARIRVLPYIPLKGR